MQHTMEVQVTESFQHTVTRDLSKVTDVAVRIVKDIIQRHQFIARYQKAALLKWIREYQAVYPMLDNMTDEEVIGFFWDQCFNQTLRYPHPFYCGVSHEAVEKIVAHVHLFIHGIDFFQLPHGFCQVMSDHGDYALHYDVSYGSDHPSHPLSVDLEGPAQAATVLWLDAPTEAKQLFERLASACKYNGKVLCSEDQLKLACLEMSSFMSDIPADYQYEEVSLSPILYLSRLNQVCRNPLASGDEKRIQKQYLFGLKVADPVVIPRLLWEAKDTNAWGFRSFTPRMGLSREKLFEPWPNQGESFSYFNYLNDRKYQNNLGFTQTNQTDIQQLASSLLKDDDACQNNFALFYCLMASVPRAMTVGFNYWASISLKLEKYEAFYQEALVKMAKNDSHVSIYKPVWNTSGQGMPRLYYQITSTPCMSKDDLLMRRLSIEDVTCQLFFLSLQQDKAQFIDLSRKICDKLVQLVEMKEEDLFPSYMPYLKAVVNLGQGLREHNKAKILFNRHTFKERRGLFFSYFSNKDFFCTEQDISYLKMLIIDRSFFSTIVDKRIDRAFYLVNIYGFLSFEYSLCLNAAPDSQHLQWLKALKPYQIFQRVFKPTFKVLPALKVDCDDEVQPYHTYVKNMWLATSYLFQHGYLNIVKEATSKSMIQIYDIQTGTRRCSSTFHPFECHQVQERVNKDTVIYEKIKGVLPFLHHLSLAVQDELQPYQEALDGDKLFSDKEGKHWYDVFQQSNESERLPDFDAVPMGVDTKDRANFLLFLDMLTELGQCMSTNACAKLRCDELFPYQYHLYGIFQVLTQSLTTPISKKNSVKSSYLSALYKIWEDKFSTQQTPAYLATREMIKHCLALYSESSKVPDAMRIYMTQLFKRSNMDAQKKEHVQRCVEQLLDWTSYNDTTQITYQQILCFLIQEAAQAEGPYFHEWCQHLNDYGPWSALDFKALIKNMGRIEDACYEIQMLRSVRHGRSSALLFAWISMIKQAKKEGVLGRDIWQDDRYRLLAYCVDETADNTKHIDAMGALSTYLKENHPSKSKALYQLWHERYQQCFRDYLKDCLRQLTELNRILLRRKRQLQAKQRCEKLKQECHDKDGVYQKTIKQYHQDCLTRLTTPLAVIQSLDQMIINETAENKQQIWQSFLEAWQRGEQTVDITKETDLTTVRLWALFWRQGDQAGCQASMAGKITQSLAAFYKEAPYPPYVEAKQWKTDNDKTHWLQAPFKRRIDHALKSVRRFNTLWHRVKTTRPDAMPLINAQDLYNGVKAHRELAFDHLKNALTQSNLTIPKRLMTLVELFARTASQNGGDAQEFNTAQWVSLLTMVIRGKDQSKLLIQQDTGEGKDRLFAVLAAYYALYGKNTDKGSMSVDALTSSTLLADRFFADYASFFEAIGVSLQRVDIHTPYVIQAKQVRITTTDTFLNEYNHRRLHPDLFNQSPRCLVLDEADTLIVPESPQQVKTIESVSQKFPSLTREIQQRLDRPGISTKERTTQWDLIAKLGNHYQAKHSDEFATLLLHLDNPELQTTINTIFKRNGTEKNTALNRLLPHFVLQEDWESVQGLTTLTATDDQLSTAIDIAYQKPPFPPLSWLKDNVEKEQDDITRAYDTFVKNPFNEDDLTQILAKKDGFDASYALQQYKKIQSAGTRKMPIDDISRLLKKLEQKLNEFDKLSQQDLLEKNNEASPSSHDATDISAEDNTLITRLAISAITLKRTAFDEQRDETGKRRIQNGKPVKQGQRLNSTQMLTLLLKLKAQSEKREVFTQIRTGEGKSRIAAVEAGVHLLSGKTIHLATSNQALARRDQKEYQQFFQGLDHQSDTIHAGLDPKTYLDLHAPKVLYSETSQWTLCHSRAIQQGNTWPKNAVLLMDECDLSLHDRNPKNIAAVKPALRNLDLVYPLITNIIQKQPKITKQALKKALEDKYPAFKQATSNYQQYDWLKQCDTWINSARKASALEQGKHFTVSVPCTQIIDGVGHQLPRITVLRNDGLPEHGSTFSDGVYQFILAKLWLNDDHRKGAFRCPPEYMTERRSYITTLCQQYDKVSGISGTTRQYEALRSPDCLPETRSVMMIPTHKNLKRKEKHRTFTSSKKKRKTIEKLLRSHAKKKTPAIIFCQDAKEVRALHQWISENTSIPTGDKAWQLRTYTSHDHVQSQHAMKAMVQQINQGGQQIIITTSVLGRGCNTSANDMLGILTHTPETKADAEQIIGRFGRYGKKATVVSLIDCQAKGYASIGADKRQEADWSTRDASDKVHRIFHDARAKLIQTVQETQTKKDFDCQRFLTETDNIWSQSPAADGQIDVLGDQYQTTMNQYTSSLINLVEYAKTQVPENTIQLDIPALVEHANQFRKDAITEQRKPMVRANKIIFGHGVVCLALSVAVVIPPVIAYFTLPTLGITEIMLIVTGMIGLSLTIIGATTALTSQHKLNKLEQISYPPLTNKTNAHELNHMKQDENNKPVNNQGRREAKTSKKTQTHGMS